MHRFHLNHFNYNWSFFISIVFVSSYLVGWLDGWFTFWIQKYLCITYWHSATIWLQPPIDKRRQFFSSWFILHRFRPLCCTRSMPQRICEKFGSTAPNKLCVIWASIFFVVVVVFVVVVTFLHIRIDSNRNIHVCTHTVTYAKWLCQNCSQTRVGLADRFTYSTHTRTPHINFLRNRHQPDGHGENYDAHITFGVWLLLLRWFGRFGRFHACRRYL